ncbi:auxin-responsive protein IAA4-like [Zingiber officinale]|uniref:Auxin-responsive protein n=1 Tax=Zingiber officinale TaxID=94328 RepID=A0A8J5KLF2_ZINOF|nr:auxin-responsive protein IAA4-like [Zingiber officinale]KAG6488298.1 hypothetical protein ZIOFF_057058 [Zingiber officinale]
MESETDNLKATELRLGLPGSGASDVAPPASSRPSKRSLNDPSQAQKAQLVGWPPVRSYRKKAMKAEAEAGLLVKVSMDGAPYLRKIDLTAFKGYKELSKALEDMFKAFEVYKGANYAITYEDKDGDLMLAGDVPWEMFTSSCKKLRIIRGGCESTN